MQIGEHTVVTIDYTLTGSDGEVIDTSQGHEPLSYLHGVGHMIPGLEQALAGKSAGDRLQVDIAPEDAYGERNEELVQVVPKHLFGEVERLAPGMQFQAYTDDGIDVVTVVAVNDDEVTVDGNHPLAGKELHFDIAVVAVRAATAEEMEHGHVHNPGVNTN
jgi:FKBP-type peptidyl-prolyl cis-trans isomerases 2